LRPLRGVCRGRADRFGRARRAVQNRALKNKPALIGYYLAVFSLIPCIGLLLAIAAVALGVRGLAVARETPEAHGKAHAWIAIVLGGLMLILQGACGVMFALALRAPS